MAITAVRIDGRLVHGQVANLSTPSLGVSRIMVVDNKVSENAIEKSGLRMATPAGTKLSVLSVDTAAEHILAGRYDSQKLFLVVKKPETLLELLEKGVELPEINVGNMSQTDETKHVNKSINVTDHDIDIFKQISAKGVSITNRMVPGDKVNDFMSLIKEL